MQPSSTTGQRAQLVALLILLTCLSQFYRVSNNVIAPELTRDLGLTATHLGWAGGVFFLALLVMQIPVGLLFDRIGARRTVAGLSIVAVAGAVLLARAETPMAHIVGRLVVGVGCAASFMSAVFLVSRWFPPERLSTALSWVFSASNIGTLIAATPLAWAAATIGWRNGFLALGALTAVTAVLFYLLVRDAPPGAPAKVQSHETAGDVLRGLLQVWKTPGLVPVLAMHTFAYAVMLTVLGVWAGPYLHAVHGLDPIARGNVMLAMGIAQIVGILCYGPMDRILGSRKKVVVMGVVATTLVLVALAASTAAAAVAGGRSAGRAHVLRGLWHHHRRAGTIAVSGAPRRARRHHGQHGAGAGLHGAAGGLGLHRRGLRSHRRCRAGDRLSHGVRRAGAVQPRGSVGLRAQHRQQAGGVRRMGVQPDIRVVVAGLAAGLILVLPGSGAAQSDPAGATRLPVAHGSDLTRGHVGPRAVAVPCHR